MYPAVFFGLSLLHLTTADAARDRLVFLRGWLWAACATLLGMRFIVGVVDRFTPLGVLGGLGALLLLAAGQAVPWGLGLWVARLAARRLYVPAPLAFAAGVTLASSITIVIGWSPGALLSPWPVLVQLAEWVGERGVTFLVALVAALCAEPLRRYVEGVPLSPKRPLGTAAVVFGIMLGFGIVKLNGESTRHAQRRVVRVGVVQPAIEARLRWDPAERQNILERLLRLTRDSEAKSVDFTAWHEAAYPFLIEARAHRMHRGRRAIIGRGVRGPVLFGALANAEQGEGRYNAATVVDPAGMTEPVQAKMQLLWFGETVPLSSVLPFLRRWFFRAGGLVPGESISLLSVGDARIGVLNCFEDTLAAVGRDVAAAGPNLLVNITNDAWFGDTAEPELHLRLSVLRSVESRRDLVRVVNLGIPVWIDAAGRIRARGSVHEPGVLVVTPALNDDPPTVYTRLGDSLLLSALALLGAVCWSRGRRRRVDVVA